MNNSKNKLNSKTSEKKKKNLYLAIGHMIRPSYGQPMRKRLTKALSVRGHLNILF